MLVVPAGGDGADAAAANDVSPPPPPPNVPLTHTSSSTLGPSPATQDTPMREPTPVREPTLSIVKEPTTFQEHTPNSPRPPSLPPYPRSEEVGPTISTRPPSPTRQTSFQEDISEGGGDYVSLPKSNEAPLTTAATAAGGVEDSVILTDLSLKLDRGATTAKKRRLVLYDSEGEEAATKEQNIDLDAFHKLASMSLGGDTTIEAAYTIYKASQDAHASSDAGHDEAAVPDDTTMPLRRIRTKRRRLRKTVTSSAFEHFQENIFAVEDTIPTGDGIPVDAHTIPAGSTPIPSSGGVFAGCSMDHVSQAAAAPSSTIPAANKGKAPMVDDSLPTDLLTEQERILKNLHDYQLGDDLAKKLYPKHEAEFARKQEELAQKAQAESVASPFEQCIGLSAQRRRELDATQLIYTKADWLELMAKIATNSTLSKQLLGDDVNEDNMNERLGMLLLRKRRELVAQSRVKPMNKTQQRDFMRDFIKNQSALVYNQGWTIKQVPASVSTTPSTAAVVSVPAAPSIATDVSVPTALSIVADVLVSAVPSVHADTEVDANESRLDDTQTASKHVSTKHAVNDASDRDDDPLPYAHYVGWKMVPTPLGSIHAYYDMEGHTKHFTSLRELLHMVEKNDLRKLLGVVDNFYQRHEPNTFALILWGDLRVHVFETVDGRVIYMFVNVSYPLSAATLKRMLKHGLEVPKLLVGGYGSGVSIKSVDGCQVTQNWMVITFHVPFWNDKWLVQGGMTLELASPEQTATGKDVSNSFMAVMVCHKPLGYFSSPIIHVSRAGLFLVAAVWLFAAVLFCSCCWNNDAILELTCEDLSGIMKLTLSNSRLGEDCWELQN
nr:JmjC domain-containing protein [Tanacetum cinerariifolium]